MKNYIIPATRRNAMQGIFDDFDTFFSPFFGETPVMKTDVKEYPDHYLLEVEVPGIAKKDVEISLSDGYLKISSVKTDENDGTLGDWKYLKRERAVGASRSFYIGDVNEGDIKATYTDGLLYVNIPKCTEGADAAPRKIEIH